MIDFDRNCLVTHPLALASIDQLQARRIMFKLLLPVHSGAELEV